MCCVSCLNVNKIVCPWLKKSRKLITNELFRCSFAKLFSLPFSLSFFSFSYFFRVALFYLILFQLFGNTATTTTMVVVAAATGGSSDGLKSSPRWCNQERSIALPLLQFFHEQAPRLTKPFPQIHDPCHAADSRRLTSSPVSATSGTCNRRTGILLPSTYPSHFHIRESVNHIIYI